MSDIDYSIPKVNTKYLPMRSKNYIYFITLDRCSNLKKKTTVGELLEMRRVIIKRINVNLIHPYQVHCFEWKLDAKNGKRLHYHFECCSTRSFIPYTDVRVKGWSNKILKLKTLYDVANTAGYIQKLKIDKSLLEIHKKLSIFDKGVNLL